MYGDRNQIVSFTERKLLTQKKLKKTNSNFTINQIKYSAAVDIVALKERLV